MSSKKKETFKPFTHPRYLPGSVVKDVWARDLEEYNQHRYRVFSAKSRIDDWAPNLNPYSYLSKGRLMSDADRLVRIELENKKILKAITKINRHGGYVDCYNPIAYASHSNWFSNEQRKLAIFLQNQEVLSKIEAAKSKYSTEAMNKNWNNTLRKIKHNCKFPVILFNKINLDMALKASPSISAHLLTAPGPRPFCFMEFKVVNGPHLGMVVIELYYDFVPVTVENFLGLCKGDTLNYKNSLVYRIVPGKFMETGDIINGNGRGRCCVYGTTFDEENHMLKHSRAGVLSMRRVDAKQNASQFIISFDKLEYLDSQNVVFGQVVLGIDVIYKIQEYGRKIGKPLDSIIIWKCGEYDGSKFKQ